MDNSSYVENGEWRLAGMPGQTCTVLDGGVVVLLVLVLLALRGVRGAALGQVRRCPEHYVDVTVVLRIQRRALYFYFNLVLPCGIISAMALVVFTLPVECGEKMGLSVTIVLSLTVFMMVVAETVPRTSDAVPAARHLLLHHNAHLGALARRLQYVYIYITGHCI